MYSKFGRDRPRGGEYGISAGGSAEESNGSTPNKAKSSADVRERFTLLHPGGCAHSYVVFSTTQLVVG